MLDQAQLALGIERTEIRAPAVGAAKNTADLGAQAPCAQPIRHRGDSIPAHSVAPQAEPRSPPAVSKRDPPDIDDPVDLEYDVIETEYRVIGEPLDADADSNF